ncbi:MAG: branched-chain amino acid ABC transporter permease [Deltaproteobacteria bacterium]|nr:branched-chain amino acid ABC transporter permease [Deltaproteobacteria bacterium]MBW2070749.1 branched-chain amino acid ABC transporter permease [Deltaproteobacteria bacterium]
MIWYQLPQFLVSGITTGSIYALVALGFAIVHNATGIVNFAQGEFVMIGALSAITFTQSMALPLFVAFPLAVFTAMAVGFLLETAVLRRSRSQSILILVMITVGASITIRECAMMVWGKMPKTLPPFSGDEPFELAHAAILPQTLWILAITFLVVAGLSVFFNHTMAGKAMRAVAENRRGAALIGIPAHRMTMLSFVLAGGIGAVAGIIVTPVTTMSYSAGVMLALKGFAAAILGGYGNMAGAVLGGLLLGTMESLAAGFISSAYKDAVAFLLLLLVLFVRPSGLLGEKQIHKV